MESDSQRATFERLWERYAPVVAQGDSFADNGTSDSRFVTAVTRLAPAIQARLGDTVKGLLPSSADLYRYPVETIHTTVLALTPYADDRVLEPDVHEVIRSVLARVFDEVDPFEYSVRGLGTFPTTVYAKVFVEDNARYTALRRSIGEGLREAGISCAGTRRHESNLDWSLSFANVARFMGTVPGSLVDDIDKLREEDFGTGLLTAIELVTTDKLLSDAATTTLATFRLADGESPCRRSTAGRPASASVSRRCRPSTLTGSSPTLPGQGRPVDFVQDVYSDKLRRLRSRRHAYSESGSLHGSVLLHRATIKELFPVATPAAVEQLFGVSLETLKWLVDNRYVLC